MLFEAQGDGCEHRAYIGHVIDRKPARDRAALPLHKLRPAEARASDAVERKTFRVLIVADLEATRADHRVKIASQSLAKNTESGRRVTGFLPWVYVCREI